MAKKTKRPTPVQEVNPGANPYARNKSYGRKLGNILGCLILLVFIYFDELWIGTLACALGFALIFGVQVFYEKSYKWYATPYLYATLLTLALAYAEFRYNFISNLLKL